MPLVVVPFFDPGASLEFTTAFGDPDGLLGSASFVEQVGKLADELSRLNAEEMCFATASDKEVRNVIVFD